MDVISSFTRDLCFCAAGCAVLGGLLPRGNLKKTGEAMLGIFFALVVVTPFAKLARGELLLPEISVSEQVSGAASVRDAIADAACESVENSLAASLTEAGIPFERVEARCHIDSDGLINIDGVRVVTDEAERARTLIENNFGIGDVICGE